MNNPKRVRLLNPSIYSKPEGYQFHPCEKISNPASYPVVVDVIDISHKHQVIQEAYIDRALVGVKELDRVFNMGNGYRRSSDTKLGWWNNLEDRGNEVSWEPVSPFDYWNKLKATRGVGETVGKGYL
ncbi:MULTISPECIES: hypothetical protein [Gammaproteobacteria]|uniref:hypothetical protein n=1 Tax=Gammaproteobacteria TaxID=1236 RepID=UPI002FC7E35B